MFRSQTGIAAITLFGVLFVPVSAQEREVSLPLGSGVDLKLIRVEPGTFTQGSSITEQNRGAEEIQREVTLTRGFHLGKYPVTRGQFAQFVKETGFKTEAEKGTSGGFGWDGSKLAQRRDFNWKAPGFPQTDNDPVVIVTWNDAKAFLGWLSRKAGAQFDLPTEAQWEYACRAGTSTAFWNGDDVNLAGEIVWHLGNSGSRTHPVGEKGENAWGFADMHGNVWEWCTDWFGPYPPGTARDFVQTNSNLSDKPRRVLRGGSWLKELASCRSASRYRNDPQSRNADNGFRVMTYQLRPVALIERTAPPVQAAEPAPPPPAVSLEKQNSTPRRLSQPSVPVANSRAPAQSVNRLVSTFGGLCCFLAAGAIVLFIARWIFKRGGLSSSTTPVIPPMNTGVGSAMGAGAARRPGSVRTRMGDDGFWIDAEGVAPETLLTCRYTSGGASQQIDVRYRPQPGGQFVYTGSRPTSVSVVMAGAAMAPFVSSEPLVNFDDDRREEAERRRRRDEEERRRRSRFNPPAY